MQRILVWDWPVRLFHWGTVLLIPMMWWTWKQGNMDLHQTLGLVILGLLAFRILWGVIGSQTARFSSFIRGPGAIWQYLRGEGGHVGHSPLAALSVVALIGVLGAQVGFGLIAQDTDGLESGPLNYLVEYDTADWARDWHELMFNVLQGLIVLHLLALIYYTFIKKDRLVAPMVTGKRDYPASVAQPRVAGSLVALGALVAAGLVAWWVSKGAPLPF